MTAQDTKLNSAQLLALRGLRLAGSVRRRMQATGVYCQPAISIEHQQHANKYVLRGVECGGAVAELGAYCGFVAENGDPISWLQPVHTVAVNGLHAVVVAATLVRVHVFRYRQAYDLLVTRHRLMETETGKRPRMENSVIFHGRQGTLALELWGRDKGFSGSVIPLFYTRSGEPLTITGTFSHAVKQTVAAACCIGCRHTHVLQPPSAVTTMVEEWRRQDGHSATKAG